MLLGAATVFAATTVSAQSGRLTILTTTGTTRNGLQVVANHPDPASTLAVLERGFSGRLVGLYALEQEFLRRKTGRTPEPAYLVLSDRQGGFPQFGFYLGDEKKPDVGWVDLHRASDLSGRLGAMDQIFPHELMHVIVHQLAGEPRESGGNQVHAIGVRTDPVNAFTEGLAEAMQILAVDDPDATDDTRRLAADAAVLERTERAVAAYARGLSSPWPVQPSRLRFLLWYGQGEQVLRYHAVKANRFARSPAVPPPLLARKDKYAAYLFSSVVPGAEDDAPKEAGAMLSSEGVVSFLFWLFISDPALQQRYEPDAFYQQFGTTVADVTPLENVFLKVFAALHAGRPSTGAGLLRAYVERFPDDARAVDGVVQTALLGQPLPDAPEIWLANDALMTGTSLFDQYRGLPRPHTFDVNAASTLDWLSVPGVTSAQASALLAAAPYPGLDALLASAAVTPALRRRITEMAAAMDRLRRRAVDEEEALRLSAILLGYLWRLAALVLACAALGALLSRRAGTRRRWTAALIAVAANLLVIAFAWVVTSPPWYPFAAPIVAGGVPLALWRLARRRPLLAAARGLVIWAAAAVPSMALVLLTS
jgi:hypothetical protein